MCIASREDVMSASVLSIIPLWHRFFLAANVRVGVL